MAKKVLKILKNIIIFALMVSLLLVAGLPMQIYAYDFGFLYENKILILIYILLAFGIFSIVRLIDKKSKKNPGTWHGEKSPINKKWFIILFIYLLVFSLFNIIQGLIMEYFDLGNALNQDIIENELVNFPKKFWLYFHIAFFAPVFEELIFRKVFMDLFFTKDKISHHILAILSSGLIFALMHEASLSLYLLLYTIPGVLLGFFYRSSKDIRLPILVHIANNLFSILSIV